MSGVKRVLAQLGGGVASAWPAPLAVLAVVFGVLTVVFGFAWAVVAAVGAARRRRERNAVDVLLGHVARPTPHRRFRFVRRTGARHG